MACLPAQLPRRDAQWDADNDPDQGDRARLPAHRGTDLALDESERLQEADLAPAPSHTDDQEVQKCGRTEQSEHEAENERKVHGFPEIDERGGGGR